MLVVTTTSGAEVPGPSLLAGPLLWLPHAVINSAAAQSPATIGRTAREGKERMGRVY